MKWRPATTRVTIAAGIASVVGPACAVLPYTDYLPPRLSPDLPGVWLLAAIGAIGIGIGVFAFNQGSKVAGTICVLTNSPSSLTGDSSASLSPWVDGREARRTAIQTGRIAPDLLTIPIALIIRSMGAIACFVNQALRKSCQ